MKYYIVINEWNYPTESGRDLIATYDLYEEALNCIEDEYNKEKQNFIDVNNGLYKEACGAYQDDSGKTIGYMLHSSQYEDEDMYFRSFIIEVEAWK